ncbi:MAG: tRNA (adenosine(37)-N6)-threonylcarbamoyltransferase complex ATPase subunit type 1 TsaE [Candidatus Paceibacterota bacterium]|jgi:tRNA threonylcarbamoyladenosine biosynthesis protein TsaE|nr:tRNA (adenosine(37)-N6)-threonylcarbamoyltransferase complex ATPase subunit type 1 TsaE [bacterium]
MKEFEVFGFKETEELGVKMAQEFSCGETSESALVITLEGELGAGKTTFLKGFARGLGVKQNIQSPTFIIMNRYSLKGKKYKNFFHLDCYRIENEKEMDCLEFENIKNNKENIICIEWGSKIEKILPKKKINIVFEVISEEKRKIKVFKF